MKHFLFAVARIALLLYAGMLGMLAGCQRQFIYYPSRASEQDLMAMAKGLNLEPWRDVRREIIGWKTPASEENESRNIVVIFHGNAGFALNRTYFVDGFQSASGHDPWHVYLFEYPGYGARGGRPSQKTIKEKAGAALNLLKDEGHRLFLVGESLGGGVACYLAGKYPDDVDGLLLITPFTSLVDVGRHHYPIFPVRLFLRERYDNLTALEGYSGPVAFMLAERDEVVPASLGMRLYEEYDGPKKLVVQKGRTHNTLEVHACAAWWDDILEFLKGSYRAPSEYPSGATDRGE